MSGHNAQLPQQIANLTAAQRVGVVAAVVISSSLAFGIYATKKHRVITRGALDSPRDRLNSPLTAFTCPPSNDINRSITDIKDGIHDNIATTTVMITGCISCNERFSTSELQP
ncbi:uncharacterized protein [Physcomitrium patens]|uniref:uncharacterized protein isoform X1 n=1 Tax=Physcomitrium patens TaxID=3218 RepID=UPI003CCE359D